MKNPALEAIYQRPYLSLLSEILIKYMLEANFKYTLKTVKVVVPWAGISGSYHIVKLIRPSDKIIYNVNI